MTPLQIAHAECANWDGNRCLGAVIEDDLQIRVCRPLPKCVLGTPGKRCLYFEDCVAPMVTGIEDPKRKAAFQDALRDYRKAAKLPCGDDRPCPMCGRPMEPKQRFCDLCAKTRHRDNRRMWIQQKRGSVSKVNGFSTVDNQPLTKAVLSEGCSTPENPKTGI